MPEHEQHGGAAHVPVVAQGFPGRDQLLVAQVQPGLDLVQDAAAAGVDGPVPDVAVGESQQAAFPGEERFQGADDVVVDDVRDVVAQDHLEAFVADVPRHGFLTDRRQDRLEVVQLQQRRLVRVLTGGHDGRCRAVGKQRRPHDGVRIVRGPHVQGAEFGADHQHDGVRIRLAERFGGPQRRERRVAAHKTEVVALHRGIQAEGADDFVVRSGVEKSGTGDRDEVSYVK